MDRFTVLLFIVNHLHVRQSQVESIKAALLFFFFFQFYFICIFFFEDPFQQDRLTVTQRLRSGGIPADNYGRRDVATTSLAQLPSTAALAGDSHSQLLFVDIFRADFAHRHRLNDVHDLLCCTVSRANSQINYLRMLNGRPCLFTAVL